MPTKETAAKKKLFTAQANAFIAANPEFNIHTVFAAVRGFSALEFSFYFRPWVLSLQRRKLVTCLSHAQAETKQYRKLV